MTKFARFTASCLVVALPLFPLQAADAPPVIEHAPEADSEKLEQDVARLRAENERITSELRDAQWALAEARTRIDELVASNAAEGSEPAQLEQAKARADEANARLATMVAGVDKLGAEKADLERRLATATKAEAEVRQQLTAAQAAAARAPTVPPETAAKLRELQAKLADTEKKLSEASQRASLMQAENELLNRAAADYARSTTEIQTLRQEKAAAAEIADRLQQTEGKLAIVLQSYSQLQAEADRLKSSANANAGQTAAAEILRREKATLEGRLAEAQAAVSASAATKSESTELAKRLAETEDKLAAALRSNTQLQTEAEKLKTSVSNTAQQTTALEAARQEKAALEKRLAQAQSEATASAATKSESTALAKRLAETESKLATALRSNTQLQTEAEKLKTSVSNTAQQTAALEALRQEKAALEERLSAAQASANANSAPSDLANRLAQTEDRLATVLRSYSQLQAEAERLKSASNQSSQLAAELEVLRKEKSALEASIAANPTDQAHHIAARLAEVEDRLATSLRSYTLLQQENDQLRADAAQTTESAQTAAARSANESANQISALFDELRQTQARVAALSVENSQLKTRLALVGPPPGSTLSSPSRPGRPQAAAAVVPATNPEPAPTPIETPAARTHTVVLGDTLGKISRQYYGTAARWEEILRANGDIIRDPNVLTVGTSLRIP